MPSFSYIVDENRGNTDASTAREAVMAANAEAARAWYNTTVNAERNKIRRGILARRDTHE